MSLKLYKQKRNFKKTSEPKAKIKKQNIEKLVFVVQKHAASHLHYDFRLELDGVLKSWAVPKGPCLDPKIKRLAVQVEDHPYDYRDFEGIIPKGQYGGGTVIVWDQGIWIPEDQPQLALRKGDLTFRLEGKKLKGLWKLIRDKRNPKNWYLFKLPDRYSRSLSDYDVTLKKPKSVLSNKTIDEVAKNYENIWSKQGLKKRKIRQLKLPKDILDLLVKKTMPSEIKPELATLVDKPPVGKEWLHELKFDGYRLLIFKHKNKIKIMTRNQNDWTRKFQSIAKSIAQLPVANLIVDGEVVVLDKNMQANFQLLQNSLKNNQQQELIYYIFDILYYDQYDLTALPLLDRKQILSLLLQSNQNDNLRYSDHIIGSGVAMFAKACELKLEGIVSKEVHSRYLQKRTRDWLKIKCIKRQEFLIGGYTQPEGRRSYFGSLLLGTYNKNHQLIYNGNVGTGFSEQSLKSVYQLLKKHETSARPFVQRPPQSSKVTWVKPVIVAEVEFTEWTKDDHLRHPSFKGIRTDKKPQQIIREQEVAMSKLIVKKNKIKKLKNKDDLNISHPNKILYPELKVTKGGVAEYYEFIHDWILPYIKKRPLTLVRCPESYKHCFYQKHLNEQTPSGLYNIPIEEKNGDIEDYIYLKDQKGLLALAQLGVLEIHPWGSTIMQLEKPDILIFDLDPAPDVAWKEVVAAALTLKKYLAQINLVSFVKSTGGKGLHVVVPIKPQHDWETIKNFSHSFVDFIVKLDPKRYVSTISKSARKGKIFIDYLRNQRGATAVAPYSTRARENATIATPLAWDELTNNIKDTTFNIKTIYRRMDHLKKDPWRDFFKIKQKIMLK